MSEVLETSLDEEAQRRVRPIVTWLLEERLNIGRTTFLFALYCQRLRDIGISLDRATIHMPQLHPQISARSLLWLRDSGGALETGHRHSDSTDDFYLRSPVPSPPAASTPSASPPRTRRDSTRSTRRASGPPCPLSPRCWN
jgi:hypothetical protein